MSFRPPKTAPATAGVRPKAARRLPGLLLLPLLLLLPAGLRGDTILASKHDLSVVGPGPIKASSESDVCVFCHTPHRGTGDLPLWNHTLSTATYTPYSSSTTKATIGQPTGSSKLCLSCHDGTVALGMIANRSRPIEMRNGVVNLPAGPSNLGTDLSDDHPISFLYDSSLVAADGHLKDPSTLTHKARLDHNNQVQCTSCHNAHDNQYGKFLVQNNQGSALCINCHSIDLWTESSHSRSPKTWNGVGPNPWPHTPYTTVAANGCENCHAVHNAGTKARLLNFADEEKNCYTCHAGTVAAKDIQSEFNKFSAHPILATSGVHDPVEDPVNGQRHVECADCHNPHASKPSPAVAPNASGALAGVKGVDVDGVVVNAVTYEYELCFRCHGDSLTRGPARVNRNTVQTNARLQFQRSNASFHPIEAQGKNPNVPSLIAPWTAASRMYCTDCHNNNQAAAAGGTGPNGPHGSLYAPILERQLLLTDYNVADTSAYALCYKCHSEGSILADQSFSSHRHHVVDLQTACTTCHDPHGVERSPRLINFNRDYVSPSSTGLIEFVSSGNNSGNCSLTCHGKDHVATPYTLGGLPAPPPPLRGPLRPR
ncbi:MAG TPA: cytochrome C [Verrucomicrobiales bacterium]|nr:cytochrome C [Verrucomicrobiales bacterium]